MLKMIRKLNKNINNLFYCARCVSGMTLLGMIEKPKHCI